MHERNNICQSYLAKHRGLLPKPFWAASPNPSWLLSQCQSVVTLDEGCCTLVIRTNIFCFEKALSAFLYWNAIKYVAMVEPLKIACTVDSA